MKFMHTSYEQRINNERELPTYKYLLPMVQIEEQCIESQQLLPIHNLMMVV